MTAYRNRTHFQDRVSGTWWKLSILLSLLGWVLVALGDYSWLVLGIAFAVVAWQGGHSGVWVGKDDILVVHPVWGRKRIPLTEIQRFAVMPFNQWMAAFVIKTNGEKVLCAGITSGRKRTDRVDSVVAKLNAVVGPRSERAIDSELSGNAE